MKRSMEFELAWQGLKMGEHILDYQLDSTFLKEKGEMPDDITDIDANVRLKLNKHESFFELHFDIDGYIITPCDRCGDDFKLSLWDEFDLIVKLSDTEISDEISEDADVVFVPRSETVLDLSKWLYEFLILSIPLQRVHPNDADGNSECNQEVLRLLGAYTERQDEKTNNIWKGLDAIKIDNNNNKKHKK
ncbi:MAG: DUF177 domain-containing protein [Chitinophagaceae bacterium]|nr:DUF177 domain-containing protein [Chitinophagaceae bacterium]